MSTKNRVPTHTSAENNGRIIAATRESINHYRNFPEQIEGRLQELDREWDIERTLEANSAALSLFGLAMGFVACRRWFLLPLAVQAFFMQHAIQGWCPPLPILRRLGVRTADEINQERFALKALRGDFEELPTDNLIKQPDLVTEQVMEAVAP